MAMTKRFDLNSEFQKVVRQDITAFQVVSVGFKFQPPYGMWVVYQRGYYDATTDTFVPVGRMEQYDVPDTGVGAEYRSQSAVYDGLLGRAYNMVSLALGVSGKQVA